MNDLFFIDYEAKTMLTDTLGMRPDSELAHRRLCDVIWSQGLPPQHDDASLRDICRIQATDWARVKGELMMKGWHPENDRFTHGGAIKTLERCTKKYNDKIAAAKAGAAARWAGKPMPTQCGGNAVAMLPDMPEQCQSQSQSQSQSTNVDKMSGSYHKDSRSVLHILNEASGKHFRETDTNLAFISERLKEVGVTLDGVRQMIARQCKLWLNTSQSEYLRPETLFNKTKFDSYYASKEMPINDNDKRNSPQRVDRSIGTANEGIASRYKDLGKVVKT